MHYLNFSQEKVITADLRYYTKMGIKEFLNYLNHYLKSAF